MNPPELNPPEINGPPPVPRFSWPLFIGAIFLPTILTVIAASTGGRNAAPPIAILGGGLSGIIAGIMVGRRFGRSDGAKVAFSFVFVAVFAVACVTMNCFGCLAGGYKLDFK